MSTISTHVLDTARGLPAPGIPVHLQRLRPASAEANGGAEPEPEARGGAGAGAHPDNTLLPSADTTADLSAVGSGTTDADGRVTDFDCGQLDPGVYRLRFDTAAYAAATGQEFFFPEVVVSFVISDERHYHVPLLLSPFAFSTYRGS
jgi:5-hydroxyisourate hydrolase